MYGVQHRAAVATKMQHAAYCTYLVPYYITYVYVIRFQHPVQMHYENIDTPLNAGTTNSLVNDDAA